MRLARRRRGTEKGHGFRITIRIRDSDQVESDSHQQPPLASLASTRCHGINIAKIIELELTHIQTVCHLAELSPSSNLLANLCLATDVGGVNVP